MDINNETINIIKKYVNNLDWTKPANVQEEAILYLSSVDPQYQSFVFDKEQKHTWENAVRIIKNVGYPKNKDNIPQLIWLLKDVNWPGALDAIDILKELDRKLVIPLIEENTLIAHAEKDEMWLFGLKMFVEAAGYKKDDFSNQCCFSLLVSG